MMKRQLMLLLFVPEIRGGGPGLMGLARIARVVSFDREPYNVHI